MILVPGVLFEYSLGAFLSWDTVAAISTIIPVLSIIAGCLMPESPSWLLSQGRKDACRNSLRRLRANNYDVEKEVQGLYEFSKRQETQKSRNFKETLAAIVEPACLKPFVILMLYFLIYQFSGVNPVTFYAVNIFKVSSTISQITYNKLGNTRLIKSKYYVYNICTVVCVSNNYQRGEKVTSICTFVVYPGSTWSIRDLHDSSRITSVHFFFFAGCWSSCEQQSGGSNHGNCETDIYDSKLYNDEENGTEISYFYLE